MGDDKSDESDSGTWDFVDEDTQIFDSQFCDSPTSLLGNECGGDTDKLHALQSTIPFDDTLMCEYESATQVMDPDDETEVANLGGETQVINLDTEHEEMEAFDETQFFNDYDTEEVVVSDHEGSDKTEIVEDSEGFSDDDSCKREPTQIIHHCDVDIKEYEPETDGIRSGPHTSGVGFKKFTSIRAASMRAAGLAALNKVSNFSKSPSCPNLNSGKSHSHDLEKVNKSNDRLEAGSKRALGRSTARKLFDEGSLAETNDANDNFDLGEAPNSPILETEFVGLSYIDSQEPGDASQANALDFVDDFLKVNFEGNDDFEIKKSTGGKSKPVLSVKGAQTFAKSADLIYGIDKRRIFDWDANLEDDGGGEFFKRNKELFFASGSRRQKSSISSRISRKFGRSESKLVLGKNKEKEKLNKSVETAAKYSSVRKNLISELDEQSIDTPGGKDIQETPVAQFDPRKNAVARKNVCLGLQAPRHDSTKTNIGCNHMQKGYRKGQHPSLSNNGVGITRSRSKVRGDQSEEVTRAKSAARNSENFDCMVSGVVKRTGQVSLKRREVDAIEAPVSPVDQQMSAKKPCVEYVTPVARRTRQSMRYDESDKDTTILKNKKIHQKLSSTRKEIGTQSISRLTRSKAATLTEQEKGLVTETEKNRSVDTTLVNRQIPVKEIGTQSIPRLTRSKAATLTEQEKGLVSERIEKNLSVCATPESCQTPVKDFSPICMGDEYVKQSCRRSFLIQEVCSFSPPELLVKSSNKDTRQKRDVSLIRVLFSRHLDGDLIKHQKKILSRLGAAESSSMTDATHFIADDFIRTRNMLEAIAFGKPIVTHLWLESCAKACCHIDEKNFILRDAEKEREFGFSLPASLARASQSPLLTGRRVLITSNTKPGKEILSSLVKAVHGVVIERIGRSLWNNDNVLEGLLILSCEEDYAACLPFLEKGAAVYSSELLLNGIVTQRLEYERHRLFLNHVKRT